MSSLHKLLVAGALALALVGCGFHPAGSVGALPKAMHSTYVRSAQPYGNLENLLRRAIVASGGQVTENSTQASAVLDIMNANHTRRVLAVNSHGQPLQYALTYHVQFRLLDAKGKALLAPQSLDLQRNFAYSVDIELGSNRRAQELVADMQKEAVQLILLRLEALQRDETTHGDDAK